MNHQSFHQLMHNTCKCLSRLYVEYAWKTESVFHGSCIERGTFLTFPLQPVKNVAYILIHQSMKPARHWFTKPNDYLISCVLVHFYITPSLRGFHPLQIFLLVHKWRLLASRIASHLNCYLQRSDDDTNNGEYTHFHTQWRGCWNKTR